MSARKTNWDEILGDITNQFITIPEEEYAKSRTVFNGVFDQIRAKMALLSPYFERHCTEKLYAGSVYDRIKISKLDEYDMDVVVSLPVSYEDITVQNDKPGFVTINVGTAFDNLDTRRDWKTHYLVTRDWRDEENYLLQNKFRSWIHGVLDKTLNAFSHRITVDNVEYLVKRKQSGPAFTLNIRNETKTFELDVDIVAVIKFNRPRWPEGYRRMENSKIKKWLVVPKPKKSDTNKENKINDNEKPCRPWRLSFQEFERELMKGLDQLKPTLKLMKKLRDSLQMTLIASYYIKTVFLWKIVEKNTDFKYWQQGLGILFRDMVNELYDAMRNKTIKYFWHEENNLISKLDSSKLEEYAGQLKVVVDGFNHDDVDKVINSLLNKDEQKKYGEAALNKNKALASSIKPVSSKGRGRHEPIASTSKPQQNPIQTTSSDLKKTSLDSELGDIQTYLKIKIESITNKINEMKDHNPNNERENGGRDLLEVISVLNSWQSKLGTLTNQDEMRELLSKIDKLADKTNEQCEIWKRLGTSDSEYIQKYAELSHTVVKLMSDNDALKADIQEAEERGEKKGKLKMLLYSAFMFIVGFNGGGGGKTSNDTVVHVNNHHQPAYNDFMVHHRADPNFSYYYKHQDTVRNVDAHKVHHDKNIVKEQKRSKDKDASDEQGI